jgi:P4 family phage/plasmid primase-like protien
MPARETVVTGVYFDSEKDNSPKPFQCSLLELIGDEHDISESKEGTRCFSFATYLPHTLRGNENVVRVNDLGLDFDHLSRSTFERLWNNLIALGCGFVMYTTFRHLKEGPDDWRVRVIIPTSRLMLPNEYPDVRAETLRMLDVAADETAKDLARIWFLPICPPERAKWAFIHYQDGPALPVDSALALAGLYKQHALAKAVPSASSQPLEVDQLRQRLQGLKKPEYQALFKAVLAGDPFAMKGARDKTCYDIIKAIAFIVPNTTEDAIVELFQPSLTVMAAQEPEGALTAEIVREKAGRLLKDAQEARASALQRGDEVELAQALLGKLNLDGDVVFDRGDFYQYNSATGLWQPLSHEPLSQRVQDFAGQLVYTADDPSVLRMSSRTVNGTITLARDRVACPGFLSQAIPGVAFTNGFVAVSYQGIRLLPHHPDHRAVFGFPFPYNPSAPAPWSQKFLCDLFLGDADATEKRELLQEFAGACVIGVATVLAKALVLLGEGRNGKSTFIRIIEALFPPAARSAIAPQLFDQEYYRAELEGKRLNSVSELPRADILRAESFKAIIAGDTITGRVIRNQPRTIKPIAGHVFAANALPNTDDLSRAFWSRFLVVGFNRVFEKHEQWQGLADYVIAQELPGVAAWALEGARRLLQRNPMRYTEPPSHVQALAEWRRNADQVAQFVEEMCDPTDVLAERTSGKMLFQEYKKWAEENGHRPVNHINFGMRLKKLVTWKKPHSETLYDLKLKKSGMVNAFLSPFMKHPPMASTPSAGSSAGCPPDDPPDGSSGNLLN